VNALIAAVQQNRLEEVCDYLDAGLDPNLQEPATGESVLAIAAFGGNRAVVEALLNAGADPNFLETTAWPLSNASGQGHPQIVELLLDHDAEVDSLDEDGGTALSDAAAGGHLEIVEVLLEAGANARPKDKYVKPAIIYAAEKGHRSIVDRLSPLSTAKDRQQAGLVLQLAEQGPPSETVKNYFAAAERGDISAVSSYLDDGGEVDAMEEDGKTAVFWAAHRGRLEVLKLLVECGADLNHVDSYGSYPLVMAGQTRDSGDPAYEFVYEHTSEKLRKDWEQRIERAKKIARERGYL
jgi:ankyrin repeat protein